MEKRYDVVHKLSRVVANRVWRSSHWQPSHKIDLTVCQPVHSILLAGQPVRIEHTGCGRRRKRISRNRLMDGPLQRKVEALVTPRKISRFRNSAIALLTILFGLSNLASANEASAEHFSAKLTCGSHSANPSELKPFQTELQFDVHGPLWTADSATNTGAGKEKFRGIISPSGAILIAGRGESEGGATWSYEFSGSKAAKGITILKGTLRTEHPKGMRTCSLSFDKAN